MFFVSRQNDFHHIGLNNRSHCDNENFFLYKILRLITYEQPQTAT